jgi:hypothetical protein
MANNIKTQYFLQELNAEYKATRLSRKNSETTFEFKPHPKSMTMGYLFTRSRDNVMDQTYGDRW